MLDETDNLLRDIGAELVFEPIDIRAIELCPHLALDALRAGLCVGVRRAKLIKGAGRVALVGGECSAEFGMDDGMFLAAWLSL